MLFCIFIFKNDDVSIIEVLIVLGERFFDKNESLSIELCKNEKYCGVNEMNDKLLNQMQE